MMGSSSREDASIMPGSSGSVGQRPRGAVVFAGVIVPLALLAIFSIGTEQAATLELVSSAGKVITASNYEPKLHEPLLLSQFLPTAEKPRWNSTRFKDWTEGNNRATLATEELLEFGPKPEGEDVEIYNVDAWHRLRILLGLEENISYNAKSGSAINATFSRTYLCSNGGSATAGGGNIFGWQRWDAQFIHMIQVSTRTPVDGHPKRPELQVVNRAHGMRGSVHSAFLMHSFIPPNADIIIWEFSINDGHEVKGCGEVNNAVITWLEQVERRSIPPPLVILVYLWDPYFPRKNPGPGSNSSFPRVKDTVFQCHDRIAAAYDFVVGSVHLGSYISNLQWGFENLKHTFLADVHHPSLAGHALAAFLLWDLATDDQRQPIVVSNTNAVGPARTDFPARPRTNWTWNRGENLPTTQKRVISLLENKYPFASWTAEEPRNDHPYTGMLEPKLVWMSSSTNVTRSNNDDDNLITILHGKASETRLDRKYSVALPCCATGECLSFNLSSAYSSSSIAAAAKSVVSAFQVYAPDITTVEMASSKIQANLVFPDDAATSNTANNNGSSPPPPPEERALSSSSSSKKENVVPAANNGSKKQQSLSSTPEWVDFGVGEHRFLNTWLVLPEATLVSRIDFCSKQCDYLDYDLLGVQGTKAVSLAHVVVF